MNAPHTEIDVDGTLFTFPSDWRVSTFDTWKQFTRLAGWLGIQGCDIVAIGGDTVWLIEVKDYTYDTAEPPEDLDETVARKAIGTMAVLFAQARSSSHSEANSVAAACTTATRIELALHINVRTEGRASTHLQSVLAPIQQQLKRTKKRLGISRALVTSNFHSSAPWHARRDPATRHLHTDR